MTETPYRNSTPPAPLVRCLLCGDAVNESSHCVRCGADAPAASLRGLSISVGCPRCARALTALQFDGGTILHCERCSGAFVTAADWAALLEIVTHGIPSVLGQLVPPPPGLGPSSEDLLKLVPCPVCAAEMDRFRFAAHTTQVVDACAKHGLWFDGGELIVAAQYVKAREARGGEPSPEEAEELRAWEQRKVEWQKDEAKYEIERRAFDPAKGRGTGLDIVELWGFLKNGS